MWGMGSVEACHHWFLDPDFMRPRRQGDCGTKLSTGPGTNFDGLKMARFNRFVGKNTGGLGFVPSNLD